MSYGLQVYDSSGNITMDANDLLWRFYNSYSVTLSGGTQSGTITVTGIQSDGNWCVYVTGSVIYFTYKITANTITYNVLLPSSGSYVITFNVLKKGGTASSGTDYGFSSYDDSGNIQIDKQYDNYVLIASGNNQSPGLANYVQLPSGYTTNNCLILVRPSSATGALQGGAAYWSGAPGDPPDNTKIYMNGAFNTPITTLGTGTATVPATNVPTTSTGTWDYRVYALNSLSATNPVSLPAYNSGYGLNVFDSSGNNIFSSNRNIPLVNSFFTQTYTPGSYKTTDNIYTVSTPRSGYRTFIVYRSLNFAVETIAFGNFPTPPYGRVVVSVYGNWNSSTQVEVGGGCVRQVGAQPATSNGSGYMTHVYMDSI